MKLMAHRGGSAEAPENTLLAFEKALKLGVTAVECDVHFTKDHHLVVIHDASVDRTTNGKGKVAELTLDEIKKLDAGAGQSIPTLTELFELVVKFQSKLMIEIKVADCEKEVIAAIKKFNYFSNTVVICFNHRILKTFKNINAKVKTGCLLLGLPVNAPQLVKEAQADALIISHLTVDKELIDQCKQHGIFVGIWNISTEDEYNYFQEMGVEYAGTDYPHKLIRRPQE